MGLLILLVVGATIGWLSTIVRDIERGPVVLANAMAGAGGAMIAGLIVDIGQRAGSLSPLALLAGIGGSLVALAAYSYALKAEAR